MNRGNITNFQGYELVTTAFHIINQYEKLLYKDTLGTLVNKESNGNIELILKLDLPR